MKRRGQIFVPSERVIRRKEQVASHGGSSAKRRHFIDFANVSPRSAGRRSRSPN